MSITCPHCDSEFDLTQPQGGSKRSHPQLKRYFALIRSAHYHWPERSLFHTPDELRYYLQIKIGYGNPIMEVPTDGIAEKTAKNLVMAGIRAAKRYVVPVKREREGREILLLVEPKSIAYATLPHAEACDIFDRVERIITTETGMDAEQLLANPPPKKTRIREKETA